MKIERPANSDLERQARRVLPQILAAIPWLEIRDVQTNVLLREIEAEQSYRSANRLYRPDFQIEVAIFDIDNEVPAKTDPRWQLYVEVTGPLNSLRKIQAIAAYTSGLPRAVPVLFMPYLNPETIAACQKAGVCCADGGGNAWIVLGHSVYIERTGHKAVRSLARNEAVPPLSSPKTENVLRVLLNEAGASRRVWRLQPLATAAGVSLGQAARVKGILDEMGVTEDESTRRRVGGFRLTEPEMVLQEWAGYVRARNYSAGANYTFHAVDPPGELQRMLTRKLSLFMADSFALSGLTAADYYAPYVRSPLFSAYAMPNEVIDLNTIEEAMDLDRVTGGVNVVLTFPRDSGVFYLPSDLRESANQARIIESKAPVVSPVQTYLDLQREGGRAREGAQYLLENYLRPRWNSEALNVG